MFKLLILIIILYVGYRLFTGKPLLGESKKDQIRGKKNDDDYTDYEELR
jgi:hypothetical protein